MSPGSKSVPALVVLSGKSGTVICMPDQVPQTMRTVDKIRKSSTSARAYTPRSRSSPAAGVPRQLKQVLEDEARSQGADIRKISRDAWTGKCTECKKYQDGICWANKKQLYNPISPGKVGVCMLKRPDGSFKGARRSRK